MKHPERSQKDTGKILARTGSLPAGVVRSFALVVGAALSASLLSACNENNNGSAENYAGGAHLSVSGTIRPRLDPSVMEKVKEEEAAEFEKRRQAAIAAAKAQQEAQQKQNLANDPANRDLPPVDTSPISGIAKVFGLGGNDNQQPPSSPISSAPSAAPPAASYGGYGGGSSIIPPPPAVSMGVSGGFVSPPAPTEAAYPPGYSPYPPGYGYPPPGYGAGYPQPQPVAAAPPSRPKDGPFGNGEHSSSSSSDDDSASKKKQQNVVLITPTGMDSRSQFKQSDDLKILIKGAFSTASELQDGKIQQAVQTVKVGLPSESTRGNLSLTQRQIDNLFKGPPLDKKFAPQIKKVESDLAQAYYRYLYAYNKFILTQQQVQAHKQEADLAETNVEKQRAMAELSNAQNEADSAKEDVRAAQVDLASIAGAPAARTVISHVTGSAPSMESLAGGSDSSDGGSQSNRDGGFLNALNPMNLFGHHGGGGGEKASAPPEKEKKQKKQNSGDTGSGGSSAAADLSNRLAALKSSSSSSSSSSNSSSSDKESTPAPAADASTKSSVSFELKNVQTTPRKSILKVAIRNHSGGNINIDPEAIYVAEGDRRLADAAVRADFDTSLVQPNQEITGTITIFGRPWNDKLTVSLSEGGKTIPLHR